MSFKKEHRHETIIYLALWTLLLLAPVMSLAIRVNNTGDDFSWSEVLWVWREYIPFFIVFLIHNHLMAPMLVYRQKKWQYIGMAVLIMVIFEVYQCNHRPRFSRMGPRHEQMIGQRPPMPPEHHEGDFGEGRPGEHPDFQPDGHPGFDPDEQTDKPLREFRGPRPEERQPPIMMGQHDIIALFILILMAGMNIGVKLYFKQRGDQKHLAELEKQNLEQQLEYLKYQINPHFFMNTLNNIHALVDIDPEKAKHTILELSKMMRFVLYEGNKAGVPLDREIAFLQNYITLMKLRYTDKVRISVDVPLSLPSKEIPPLMFITFVENAFKHGVSYRKESFIDVQLKIEDDTLVFCCRNSRIPAEEDKHGGVGLANVKQRLDLIYGTRYKLDIDDQPDVYTVTLSIPL